MPYYVLDEESVDFLISAQSKASALPELHEAVKSPYEFAQNHNLNINPNIEERLLRFGEINASFNFHENDPINHEVTSFFNIVVIDGRYINAWCKDPGYVAHALGMEVSSKAIDRIHELKLDTILDLDYYMPVEQAAVAPILIGIAIVAILILWPTPAYYALRDIVVDRSTLDKV